MCTNRYLQYEHECARVKEKGGVMLFLNFFHSLACTSVPDRNVHGLLTLDSYTILYFGLSVDSFLYFLLI